MIINFSTYVYIACDLILGAKNLNLWLMIKSLMYSMIFALLNYAGYAKIKKVNSHNKNIIKHYLKGKLI